MTESIYFWPNSKNVFESKSMDILYINVIEQNAGWGAETFLNNGFQSLGHVAASLDYRKHRQVLTTKLKRFIEN